MVLRGFDEDIRINLDAEMKKRGVNVIPNKRIDKIEDNTSGFNIYEGTEKFLESDLIMYATGRSPNTANIGLENVGIELKDNGSIKVDDWNRTTVPNIYAVGDVTDRIQLTPVAIQEGASVSESLFNDNPIIVAKSHL